jgi:hypothetical protein
LVILCCGTNDYRRVKMGSLHHYIYMKKAKELESNFKKLGIELDHKVTWCYELEETIDLDGCDEILYESKERRLLFYYAIVDENPYSFEDFDDKESWIEHIRNNSAVDPFSLSQLMISLM